MHLADAAGIYSLFASAHTHTHPPSDLRTQQVAANSQFFDQLELGSVNPLSLDGQRYDYIFV